MQCPKHQLKQQSLPQNNIFFHFKFNRSSNSIDHQIHSNNLSNLKHIHQNEIKVLLTNHRLNILRESDQKKKIQTYVNCNFDLKFTYLYNTHNDLFLNRTLQSSRRHHVMV